MANIFKLFTSILGSRGTGLGLEDSCIGKKEEVTDEIKKEGAVTYRTRLGTDGGFYTQGGQEKVKEVLPIKGVRVWPNAMGYLVSLYNPCDYGRAILTAFTCPYILLMPQWNWWRIITPAGVMHTLDPAIHTVEEHSDGSITVTPEIVTPKWRGTLTQGIFKTIPKNIKSSKPTLVGGPHM